MKEVIFKAETDDELYKLAKAFCDGFIKNSLTYHEKFKQLNPIGKEIVKRKGSQTTTLTAKKEYQIVGFGNDNKVYVLNDNGLERNYSPYLFDYIDYPDKDIYK